MKRPPSYSSSLHHAHAAAGSTSTPLDMLPPINGVNGVAASFAQSRHPATSSRHRRPSSASQRMLTPSMAQITTQDVVVQLQGFPTPPLFKIGGRQGNAVTMTQTPKVHRGWRIVAVNGTRLQASKVASALSAAQKSGRYTVTFRLGVDDDGDDQPGDDSQAIAQALRRAEEDDRRQREELERLQRQAIEEERQRLEAERLERLRLEAAEKERRRQKAEEAERKRLEAEEDESRRREAEEAARAHAEEVAAERGRREAEDAERRRLAEEAERKRREDEEAERRRVEEERRTVEEAAAKLRLDSREAEEAERRLREAMEEAERLARQKEAQRRRLQEARAAEPPHEEEVAERRKSVEHLQKATGLPPREDAKEPQKALLQALTAAPPPPAAKPNGPCDKCDGPHDTDACPHFKKKREEHADAWSRYGKKGGTDDGDRGRHVLKSAKVVSQPGDGSCLFHSLAYGLKSTSASVLRAEIADFIAANPDVKVADNPLRDWILWDAGMDTAAYGRAMRTGSRWGGAVELAVCAQLKKVSVHVYEREKSGKGFVRISTFGGSGGPTVSLLYGGRVHYDALQV